MLYLPDFFYKSVRTKPQKIYNQTNFAPSKKVYHSGVYPSIVIHLDVCNMLLNLITFLIRFLCIFNLILVVFPFTIRT